jgi:hypothetical protein
MRRGQPRQESRTPVHNALPDLTVSIDAHVAFTAGAQLAICASRGATVRSLRTCPFGELRAVEATVLGPGIYACTVIEPLTSIGWS